LYKKSRCIKTHF